MAGRPTQYQKLSLRATADIKNLKAGLGRMRAEMRKTKKSSRSLSGGLKNIAGSLGLAFGSAILISGIRSVVSNIAKFESIMRRTALIAGGAEKELTKLALTLGKTTVFSADEAGKAMQFLAQAGFSANQILKATPGVLSLAAAAQLDLARAADITSNILTGYGLEVKEVDRVNDLLVTTSNSANLNVEQLGESFQVVAPLASNAGIEIEQTAALIGVLGDAGIQGTKAGRQLKNVIAGLLDPTPKAAKELKKLGFQLVKNKDGSINLTDTLGNLNKAGMTTVQAFRIFGEIGAAAALVMANATEKAKQLETANHKLGVANKQAADQLDTLSGDIKKLESAWDGLIKKGGSLNTTFRSLIQSATDFITGISGGATPLKDLQERLANLKKEQEGFTPFHVFLFGDNLREINVLEKAIEKLKKEKAKLDNQLAFGGKTENLGSLFADLEINPPSKVHVPTQEEIDALDKQQKARDKAAKATLKHAKASEILKSRLQEQTQFQSDTNDMIAATNILNLMNYYGMLKLNAAYLDTSDDIVDVTEGLKDLGDVQEENIPKMDAATEAATRYRLAMKKSKMETILNTVAQIKSIKELANSTVEAIRRMAISLIIKKALKSKGPFFGTLIKASIGIAAVNAMFAAIPKFASGGRFGGGPMLVGERGPEIVVPDGGGRVIPNNQLGGQIKEVRLSGEYIYLAYQEYARKIGS